MENESPLLPIHKAVKAAAKFRATDDDPRFALQHVRVRDKDVTGTDGHTLLVVPVEKTGFSTDRLLDDRDTALVVCELPLDNEALSPNPVGLKYPNTDETVQKMRAPNPVIRFGIQTAYLQRIGQVFKSMGVGYVECVLRAPDNGVEFIGKKDGELIATAFVMPVKI